MLDRIDVNIEGLREVPLPRMAAVRQIFDPVRLDDVTGAVAEPFAREEVAAKIKPGASIAIGAGSRGVANIGEAVTAVVAAVKARGGEPFVFPAMGSHGGATAEGQLQVLATYGITEQAVGAPVKASMDTVVLGNMPDGTPVHMDRMAHEADGVILINRIKPHTTFRGAIESGLVKMIAIGMGKIAGATILHNHGMDRFPEVLPPVAEFIMARIPFLCGIGMVENAYDETALLEALLPETLVAREMELQARAKELMGRLCFDDIDVLVIERMGKEVSGAGFDPNITGRNSRGVEGFDLPRVNKIVVLDLTGQTHGNATGIGVADVITMQLFRKIDFNVTYANVITSAYLDGGLIPIIMNTPQEAIQLAAKTVPRVKPAETRIVRIRDTLTLGEILVSEPLLAEVESHSQMEQAGQPQPFLFDDQGNPLAA
ncbi:MAG: lactate racemase domain-containing protein [SAR324 cluster bacterium]|nr:lactate racemase domain-containing protein [SAR324 cluster bacterium]